MPTVALLLALVLMVVPATALGRAGSLAVINVGGKGVEVVRRANQTLTSLVGVRAREPGIASLLSGSPDADLQPGQQIDRDLVRIVRDIRGGKPTTAEKLSVLGQLLGVDYLLMLRVMGDDFSARLYSVHRRAYASRTHRGRTGQEHNLRAYVREQVAGRPGAFKTRTRWWIWAIAAGLGALAIGMAIAGDDGSSGDLRIRVSR